MASVPGPEADVLGDRDASPLAVCGWRERVDLPQFGITRLRAKVDTGARSSALHAFRVRTTRISGVLHVEFALHPRRGRTDRVAECIAPVLDRRRVRDSGGHEEMRYVIETPVRLGDAQWSIEMTLTDREDMRFRMLLGRTAIRGRYLVDPGASWLRSPRRSARRARGTQPDNTESGHERTP